MRKIKGSDVLPHIIAIVVFLLVTVFFFSPIFFDNKSLSQPDIQQFQGGSKTLSDYRASTAWFGPKRSWDSFSHTLSTIS